MSVYQAIVKCLFIKL